MPKPERPGWVTLLRYVWPHTLGLVLLVSAVVWGLRQTNSPETRAVAGALAIWMAETAALGVYYANRYSLVSDPDGLEARVYPAMAKRQSWIRAMLNLGPGLWIGLVSRSPVTTAIAARLTFSLLNLLSRLRVASVERKAISVKPSFARFGIDLVWMFTGAIIGNLARLWLGAQKAALRRQPALCIDMFPLP
jgi:hypothetical protein